MRDNLDELRHIEGFPIGEDEYLHALSNPTPGLGLDAGTRLSLMRA